MSEAKSLILSSKEVEQKLVRIAYEIYEKNVDAQEIVFAGILDTGYKLASILKNQFEKITPIKASLVKVSLDKLAPTQSEISLDIDSTTLNNKVVILVDDVLQSGRTLAYSLKPFLNVRIKKIEIAVLVNRDHPKFPLSATYTGYSLATTIKEHIDVRIKDEDVEVYLY